MIGKTKHSTGNNNDQNCLKATAVQQSHLSDGEQEATHSDARLENLKQVADLLYADYMGDSRAKVRVDAIISAVVAKIDAVGNEGGPLDEACAKHGLPLSLFATSIRVTPAFPIAHCLLAKSENAPAGRAALESKDLEGRRMNPLDSELKLQVIGIAISSLTDEFKQVHARFLNLGELEQFVDTMGAVPGALEVVLNARNVSPAGPFCRILDLYPTFWPDLARNIGYESLPRNIRPDRDVT